MSKSKRAITERQRFWLNHIQAADGSDGSLVDYAAAHKLKVKDLYQWKTLLVRRGFLTTKQPEPKFVAVAPAAPSVVSSGCHVTLPNGVRLQFSGDLSNKTLDDIFLAASRLA